jgi:Zn-dependent membrane protease YugP
MFFIDPLYLIIVGPAILFAMWAQWKVKSAFSANSERRASSGLTGAEAARKMLEHAGLSDVQIERSEGQLSDHYNPQEKKLALSPDVHDKRTLSAVGVACHEAGHAIQDAEGYLALNLRNAVVPMASIGSNLAFPLILIGLLITVLRPLLYIGIIGFSAVVLFQLINLPVEFNASSRAKDQLAQLNIIRGSQEQQGVEEVLSAAAMTYVAATITAVAQLLYFLLLARR